MDPPPPTPPRVTATKAPRAPSKRARWIGGVIAIVGVVLLGHAGRQVTVRPQVSGTLTARTNAVRN